VIFLAKLLPLEKVPPFSRQKKCRIFTFSLLYVQVELASRNDVQISCWKHIHLLREKPRLDSIKPPDFDLSEHSLSRSSNEASVVAVSKIMISFPFPSDGR
jgi:hypothetical protein